jgi:methylmalonyl-CoA mutase cobalamin-binding subunit
VIQQNRARVAVIAIVQEADRSGALDVADALRAAGNRPVLAVGGKHARWDEAQEAGIVVLPGRINEAASVVVRLATGTIAAK